MTKHLATPELSDWLFFWAVAAARLLLPLIIPRHPLPGIVAALLLDGIDQTLFQQFTSLPLDGYQGYDKALDIYYLTIAYVSTLRNWSNHFAFQVSRFLFYWRLVGVALFELTQMRWLLLAFPNTFEYFFIFYEAYRLRWDPKRMSTKFVIAAAAFIWIVIKLPQEYWIHIGQLDTTDWIKTNLFGVSANTPWAMIFALWPWVFVAALTFIVLLVAAIWWLAIKRLPPPHYRLALDADAHQPAFTTEQVRTAFTEEAREIVDWALAEKLVMVTLVSVIFSQVLPGLETSTLPVAIGVALLVFINTALSHWLARRGYGWAFTLRQFAALAAVNVGLSSLYVMLAAQPSDGFRLASALFIALLLTLLVTFYDRYRQVYLMRFVFRGKI